MQKQKRGESATLSQKYTIFALVTRGELCYNINIIDFYASRTRTEVQRYGRFE